MDPQQPQQPQQPVAPPQPPTQNPSVGYTQPQPVQPSVPQPEYQSQPTPAEAPNPVAPPQPFQQPYQAQPYPPQPTPGQFGPASPVPPQPAFPSQPPTGVFGSGPAAPYTPEPAKGKGKLFALIGIIVAGLIVLGVGVWALMTFVFASISLETYKGDGYSILVPKDYKKEEVGSAITYTSEKKKGSNGEDDVYSAMYITSGDYPTGTAKDQYVELYDKYFDEDAFKQSLSTSKSDNEIKNFKSDKTTYQGFTARKYTADAYQNDTKVGTVRTLIVFGDKKLYSVALLAHAQVEAGFRASADKILNSLKIDE